MSSFLVPPVLSYIDPAFGPPGGGINVTVIGNGFFDSPFLQCKFGNIFVSAEFINETFITCAVPPGQDTVEFFSTLLLLPPPPPPPPLSTSPLLSSAFLLFLRLPSPPPLFSPPPPPDPLTPFPPASCTIMFISFVVSENGVDLSGEGNVSFTYQCIPSLRCPCPPPLHTPPISPLPPPPPIPFPPPFPLPSPPVRSLTHLLSD